MSLIDRLNAIGSFTVGAGGDATAPLPVLSLREKCESVRAGSASGGGQNGRRVRRLSWSIRSMALAADSAALPALLNELVQDLARTGEVVTVNELGGATRTMPAGGAVNGSIAGYPRVIAQLGTNPMPAPWTSIEVECETLIPEPEAEDEALPGFNLVEHEWERETRSEEDGGIVLGQRGSVRVANGQSAADWIEDAVMAPARTAAGVAGRRFINRVTTGPDAAFAKYTWDYASYAPSGFDVEATVTIRVIVDHGSDGRQRTTITGNATGPDAEAFALDQEPTPVSGEEVLAVREVSEPSISEGRVDFRYEVLRGVAYSQYSGYFILEHSQSIQQVGGGRSIVPALYAGVAPALSRGPSAPYAYRESTSITYIGTGAPPSPARLMSVDNQSGADVVRLERGSGSLRGVSRVTVERVYLFSTAQTLPTVLEPSV